MCRGRLRRAEPNRLRPSGRVAQWESARFTRERSQVRNPPRPSSESPVSTGVVGSPSVAPRSAKSGGGPNSGLNSPSPAPYSIVRASETSVSKATPCARLLRSRRERFPGLAGAVRWPSARRDEFAQLIALGKQLRSERSAILARDRLDPHPSKERQDVLAQPPQVVLVRVLRQLAVADLADPHSLKPARRVGVERQSSEVGRGRLLLAPVWRKRRVDVHPGAEQRQDFVQLAPSTRRCPALDVQSEDDATSLAVVTKARCAASSMLSMCQPVTATS